MFAKGIYEGMSTLFNGSVTSDVSEFMAKIYGAVWNALATYKVLDVAFSFLSGIAVSLLILWFFVEITGQASRDMLTLEKLIVQFIKLIIACAVLLCLQDIVTGIVSIGYRLFLMVSDDSSDGFLTQVMSGYSASNSTITYFGESSWPSWDKVQSEFESQFKIFKGITLYGKLLLPTFIMWIAKLAGLFISASNGVMIIARAIFSPIAVVQLFEDGTKSAGIRYLKKFAAECMTMACIAAILIAVQLVTQNLMQDMINSACGSTGLTVSNIDEVLTWGNLAILIAPQLVAVGGMGMGAKIANDIVGANG